MPIVGSKESIEFAGRSTTSASRRAWRRGGLQDDIIRYYAKCLAANGHAITPDHLSLGLDGLCRRQQGAGGEGMRALSLYFNRTLFSHGNFTETSLQRQVGYSVDASTDYVRPENLHAAQHCARGFPQH